MQASVSAPALAQARAEHGGHMAGVTASGEAANGLHARERLRTGAGASASAAVTASASASAAGTATVTASDEVALGLHTRKRHRTGVGGSSITTRRTFYGFSVHVWEITGRLYVKICQF